MNQWVRYVLQLAATAALYLATARASLELAIPPGYATAVWPPAGIALAALWLWGARLWPAVWIGATAVNYTIQYSLPAAAAIGVGNTLEALLGVWLLDRLLRGRRGEFESVADVFRLCAAALAGGLVAASVATAALSTIGAFRDVDAFPTWLTWWLGDACGMVLVVPLVHAWRQPARVDWRSRPRRLELAAFAAALIGAGWAAFSEWLRAGPPLPIAFVVLPLLVWAAVRFSEREVATAGAALALAAVVDTAGGGTFARAAVNESLLLLQGFMSVMLVTGLALAVSVRQQALAAERMRAAKDELQHLMDIAAHDLQEPARAMVNFSDLLGTRYGERLDGGAREILAYISAGAARMQQQVQGLLATSRVNHGRFLPEPVPADEALAAALQALRGRIRETGAEVGSGPLPVVYADPRLLGSLFQNLIGNALNCRGAVPLRVRVEARDDGKMCQFSVRDNGIGIAPQYREEIFEMFRRIPGGERGSGAGVGLALCKRIVERHGGRIWVESRPGEGATFHFTLPSLGERTVTETRKQEPIKVLLVEDSEADARMVREALGLIRVPHALHVVPSAETALAFLRREGMYADAPAPDLLLLDLHLPGMHGHELIEQVRRDASLGRFPIVVLTVSRDEDDVRASFALAADEHITKPTGLLEYAAEIRFALNVLRARPGPA